mmetsp:Transcript_66803/g.131044  ORF Transcript_66803/g.131044 Transcript_66803/m.131044 type:complete len:122 (-) Transcript_66803:398-763(-)
MFTRLLRPIGYTISRNMASTTNAPKALLVSVEIEPSRVDAFLEAMRVDARGSRNESDCHTFDLLRDESNAQKFYFYEVYKDAAAIEVHKETAHYKAWADFKAGGGVLSQTVIKASAIDFTF